MSALHASDPVWVTPAAGATGPHRKGTIAGFIQSQGTKVLAGLANGNRVQVPVGQIAPLKTRQARR